MPGVQRRSKETPFRPFKSLLAHAVVPDLGAAASLQYVQKLVIHVSFRLERAAGRNLDDVHTCNAAATLQLDVRAGPPHARPRLARQLGYVFDGEAVKNWNAFLLHPLHIGWLCWFVDDFVHRDSSVLKMKFRFFNSF